MDKLLKNQRLLFVSIFGGLTVMFLIWYYMIHHNLSKQHQRSTNAITLLSSEVEKFRKMESQLDHMQEDWETVNAAFETIIGKIPDKRLYENVTDFLYSMIINHGLKIQKFEPSRATVEKKTILIPETGAEVTIEKIPIDITLRGSFIKFGQLLESMMTGQYRLTASNIEVLKKQKARDQTIKFISYAYFQSQLNNPNPKKKITPRKNKTTGSREEKKTESPTKAVKEKVAVANNMNATPDSVEGVPEMWLEPATEPVDEAVSTEVPRSKNEPKAKPKTSKKKTVDKKKTDPIAVVEKKKGPAESKQTNADYISIDILNSMVCKKVKNNQPLYPGKRFPTDIGRVYCHALLNNNSGKPTNIYHVWYMNGNLKAKVRIRVRDGQEIPAVSHREIGNSDKGTWKIEITDSDKKILDTVIFEVV